MPSRGGVAAGMLRAAAVAGLAGMALRAAWPVYARYREWLIGPLCKSCSAGHRVGQVPPARPGEPGPPGRFCAACLRACLTASDPGHACPVCSSPRP